MAECNAPSGTLETIYTTDYIRFQLQRTICGTYQCNGDNEPDDPDTARPPFSRDQNTILTFTSNTRDTIARSLNSDVHSVEAELESMLYHVDGDDNDTAAEG